jgi:uncharacterized RDD family membrane protein YckC
MSLAGEVTDDHFCSVAPDDGEESTMSDTQNTSGAAWRNDPYGAPAYDASYDTRLYSGVLTKRFIAFLIDLFVLGIPIVLLSLFILLFGIVTLGLGWALFWLVSPLSIVWALVYYGASLGGRYGATIGMRMMDLRMLTRTGEPPYFLLGVAHAVLYWVSVSFLTPFIVLVGFFNRRAQLLHDMVLGTVIVNASVSLPVVQPSRPI